MNKRLRISALALSAGLLFSALAGCGGAPKRDFSKLKLKDGHYTAVYKDETEDDKSASTCEVELTIEGGRIVACGSRELDAKGNVKDESYGKGLGGQSESKAQIALEGIRKYPELLVQKQDPETVDGISGATVSLKRFKEAVWKALEEASK